MELTSPVFFISLGVLFALHWLGPIKLRSFWLLAGSYALYALWDLRYILILILSTGLDFTLGRWIDREGRPLTRKTLLLVSLCSNLGILFFFKYANFALGLYSQASNFLGLPTQHGAFEIFVPLGVSFYTFHSISYIVDIYYRKIPACNSILEYALYVSFFPKLISGPIERTESFISQLRNNRFFQWEDFFQALKLVMYGLFLKLCISDRLNFITDKIFAAPSVETQINLWTGFYAYSFQIYADFFGYTMLATGAALFFGIKLSPNFIHPYLSASPQEFWRRWHITLSFWFRDYVYIPLGGSRRRLYFNIMATMALAGLWHGADLKFATWGLFHGLLVCGQRLVFPNIGVLSGWKRLIGVIVTFHLVSFGWLFFKSKNFSSAIEYAVRMFTFRSEIAALDYSYSIWMVFLLFAWAICAGVIYLFDRTPILSIKVGIQWWIPLRGALIGVLLLLVVLLGVTNAEPFVYFYF